MNTIELMLEAIKSLRHAYLNLLEAGRECILDLGGTCDPVDVMEDRDPYLAAAVKAIAAGEQELKREPVAWLDTNRWEFVSGARSPVAQFPSGNWVPLYTPTIGETK